MTRLLLLTACLLALLTSAGCGGNHASSPAKPQPTATTGAPRDLHNIDELRIAFNAHAGEPRLIVLVSPT